MPPPDAKLELSPNQIETLRRWIQQGAEFQGHDNIWGVTADSMPKFTFGKVARIDDGNCIFWVIPSEVCFAM